MAKRRYRRARGGPKRGVHWTAAAGAVHALPPVSGSDTYWIPLFSDNQFDPGPYASGGMSTQQATLERVILQMRVHPDLSDVAEVPAAGQTWTQLYTAALCMGTEEDAENGPSWRTRKHDAQTIEMGDAMWFEGGVDTLHYDMFQTSMGPSWTNGADPEVFYYNVREDCCAVQSWDVRVRRKFRPTDALFLVIDPDEGNNYVGRGFYMNLVCRILYRR